MQEKPKHQEFMFIIDLDLQPLNFQSSISFFYIYYPLSYDFINFSCGEICNIEYITFTSAISEQMSRYVLHI